MEEVSNVDLRISEAVASIFTNPKVTAEDLRERYNDEFQGMMDGESGNSIQTKANLIWHALCYAAYETGIPVKTLPENKTIIQLVHELQKQYRSFQKNKSTRAKENINIGTLAEAKKKFDNVQSCDYKQLTPTELKSYENRVKTYILRSHSSETGVISQVKRN